MAVPAWFGSHQWTVPNRLTRDTDGHSSEMLERSRSRWTYDELLRLKGMLTHESETGKKNSSPARKHRVSLENCVSWAII